MSETICSSKVDCIYCGSKIAEYHQHIESMKEQISQVKAALENETEKLKVVDNGKDKLLLVNKALLERTRKGKDSNQEQNQLIQLLRLSRKVQQQQELADLAFKRIVTRNASYQTLDDLLWMMKRKTDESRLDKGEIEVVETSEVLKDQLKESFEKHVYGSKAAQISYSKLESLNMQLKERISALESEEKKMQLIFYKLQEELDQMRLQQVSKDVSHNAIVEALEVVAEEEQRVFSLQKEQLEEKLEASYIKGSEFQNENDSLIYEVDKILDEYEYEEENLKATELELIEVKMHHDALQESIKMENDKLMPESEWSLLRKDITSLLEQHSEIFQDLITEKRLHRDEVSCIRDLVDIIIRMKDKKADLVQIITKTETEKGKYKSICINQQKDMKRLNEYVQDLEVYKNTQDELLKELNDKKDKRKGWKRLKCW